MANEETTEVKSQLSTVSELVRALADLSILSDENLRAAVTEHITSIYDVKTPVEKVKRRPDGLDYIESTWMDKTWKEFSPLYEYSLLMHNESLGYVDIIVMLKDRVTGNTELGAGSARIQVKRGTGDPEYSNILDKGNQLKAALTNAIKNAQSRFGVGADIYGKREETRTEEEEARFRSMLVTIKKIAPSRAQMFEIQWSELGVDYTEYLDRWQVLIDHKTSAESTSGDIVGDDTVTGEKSLFNQKTSDVANTADTMKKLKF
jgi:hypothetical protein